MNDVYTADLRPRELIDFPTAELMAMELDGVLWRAGGGITEGWTSVDTSLSPETRASAIAHLVRERETVIGDVARWIHLGGTQPEELELATTRGGVRLGHPHITRYERIIPEASRERIAGVWVVTRARAAFDELRNVSSDDVALIEHWLATFGVSAREVLLELEHAGRVPGITGLRRQLYRVQAAS